MWCRTVALWLTPCRFYEATVAISKAAPDDHVYCDEGDSTTSIPLERGKQRKSTENASDAFLPDSPGEAGEAANTTLYKSASQSRLAQEDGGTCAHIP